MEITERRPKGVGLRIIELLWIDPTLIKRHQKEYTTLDGGIRVLNVTRPDGLNNTRCGDIRKLKKSGEWRPYHYIPPVVVKKDKKEENPNKPGEYWLYDLIAGEHRLHSHLDLAAEMWVAVCEFVNDEDPNQPGKIMSGEFWASTYQSNENNPDVELESNPRTDEGILSITLDQIDKGHFGDNWEKKDKADRKADIKYSLKAQKVAEYKHDFFIERVNEKKNIPGAVRLTTKEDCIRELEENNVFNKDIFVMTNKNGRDPDYDKRIHVRFGEFHKEYPNKVYKPIIYFTGMNEEKVKKVRPIKNEVFTKDGWVYQDACDIKELYDNGTVEKHFKPRFMGQLDNEGLYAEDTEKE